MKSSFHSEVLLILLTGSKTLNSPKLITQELREPSSHHAIGLY